MNISWTLNGRNVKHIKDIDIARTNRRTSQLTIEAAQAHHSGQYTCIAQNSVGIAKYFSYLNVNGILMNTRIIYLISVRPEVLISN